MFGNIGFKGGYWEKEPTAAIIQIAMATREMSPIQKNRSPGQMAAHSRLKSSAQPRVFRGVEDSVHRSVILQGAKERKLLLRSLSYPEKEGCFARVLRIAPGFAS